MFNPVPDGWERVVVGDLIARQFSGPSPTCEERNTQSEKEWGVLKTTAVTWSGFNEFAHKTLPQEYWGLKNLEIKAGDVLVTKAGPRHRVGVVVYVPSTQPRLIVSGKMIALRLKPKIEESAVVAGLLSQREAQKYLDDRTTGMAESQLNFTNTALLNTPLVLPPKDERVVISKVKESLDTQIRQTEAIIAKLQQVKQGLLHDLLTRGIDANGQLRPPRDQAPELYKESPLGWIPREWDAVPLGQMLNRIEGGWSPNCPEIRPSASEWGVLKVSAVTSGVYKDHEAKVLPVELKPRPGLEVKEGDVILTRANGNPSLVAKTVMVDSTQGKLMLSDKLLRLIPESSLLPFFLYFLMDFYKTRHQIAALVSGSSGQKNISQKQIRGLIVPQLTLYEQGRAVEKVQSINSRIICEHLELTKLKKQKFGLMDDLLTGRVRVNHLIDTPQAS